MMEMNFKLFEVMPWPIYINDVIVGVKMTKVILLMEIEKSAK